MLSMVRAAGVLALVFLGEVHADTLGISTWGGAYGEAYHTQVLQPFALAQGIQIERNIPVGEDADVVELSLHEAIDGCDSGELMVLPPATLDALGSLPGYLPNSIQPCAVGQWSWATVVAFAEHVSRAHEAQPALISDFFNTDDFPGKRVLKRSPRVLAEWALAASGVPANKIYPALSESVQVWPLIEKQLRLIENDVIWVDSDAEALDYLNNGTATFAMLSSSGAFRAAVSQSSSPGILWDAAVIELSMLAIPAKARHPELSDRLLRHISESDRALSFAASFGLSPVKLEIAHLINNEFRKYLPADAKSYENAIWGDSVWWQSADALEIVESFAAWVERVTSTQSLAMADSAEIASAAVDTLPSPGNVENLFIDTNF